MSRQNPNAASRAEPQNFRTTHWTAVLAAGADADTETPGAASAALELFCRSYWAPLYPFARRRGSDPDAAQDLVQAFFLHLLEHRVLAGADRHRGRFRTYLLGCFSNFLVNAHKHAAVGKRGGAFLFVPLDDVNPADLERRAAAQDWSPECAFDVSWALAVVDRAVQELRAEATQRGKARWFDELRNFLPGSTDPALGDNHAATESGRALAGRLGITAEALKTAVHRLRARFRELVREEVARTVETPDEIDAELRHLRATLSFAQRAGW